MFAFRLLTARRVGTRGLVPGALTAAILWQILQSAGTYYFGNTLRHSSVTYGLFGVVLGLLPTKGLPLPFVSSGGSSMLVSVSSVSSLPTASVRSPLRAALMAAARAALRAAQVVADQAAAAQVAIRTTVARAVAAQVAVARVAVTVSPVYVMRLPVLSVRSHTRESMPLKSLTNSFSGLQLVCLMYVAFKQIAPGQDVGFDLSRTHSHLAIWCIRDRVRYQILEYTFEKRGIGKNLQVFGNGVDEPRGRGFRYRLQFVDHALDYRP